jgi:hypothetical protein
MKNKVWNRQKKEGVSDCYAKGYDDCTEYKCAFFESCSEYIVQEWERENNVKNKDKEV